MSELRVLHLTIKRKWFDLIATGAKTVEWRPVTPYYIARLEHRTYDLIEFRNGYRPDSPRLLIEFLGAAKRDLFPIEVCPALGIRTYTDRNGVFVRAAGVQVYAIRLGRLIGQPTNWPGPKELRP